MNILSRSTVIAVLAISQLALAQESNSGALSNAQNTTTTTVVVEQPTTTVEATPLVESAAERLRKKRQESEVQTEQKIVEKLESSRLEDEQKRADRLFGNKLDAEKEKKDDFAAPVYQQQQMPQTQVVVPLEKEKATSEDVTSAKKEILDAISVKEKADAESKAVLEIPKEEKKNRYYISGSLGSSEYSEGRIEGKGAAGFTVGYETDEHMMIEAGLLYSNYFMEDNYWVTGNPVFKEVDQYNIGLSAKYSFLTGRLKPWVGGSMSYTYRKYFDRLAYDWYGGYIPQDSEATSSAFDLGLMIGLDFLVTDAFAVGVEYRYSTNMIYRTQDEILNRQYRPAGSQLLEETDYSALMISGKVRF